MSPMCKHPATQMMTTTELSAIEFYSENLQYVDSFGLSNLDREDRILFRQGKKLVETALQLTTKKVKSHVKWTADEYDAIAECYHLHEGNRPAIVDAFMKFSTRHSADAVDIAAQSCKALDTKYPQTGMSDYADGLLIALNSITPGRFRGNR